MKKTIFVLALATLFFSCKPKPALPLIDAKAFVTTADNKPVALYTLESETGMTMQVTNFGGRVVSLFVPNKDGKYDDIVLGYENIDRYVHNKGERFLGATVGRYANRIAKGQFTMDSISYQLPLNNNGQTLHGGLRGLDMVVWTVDSVSKNQIQLAYTSPDGEDGFPGALTIKMIYTLINNDFEVSYSATTDKATPVNLSHHSFFNLLGEANGSITDHILTINASNTTPVDSVLIPTGQIVSVEGTPFDFRKPTAIGARINVPNDQLKNGAGYDHNWVLDRKSAKDIELAATVYEPTSGRVMEVWTDQPGLQFYSGNFFDGSTNGKYGKALKYRESIALETQKFPDSPNHPNFPSTRLNPGETYTQTCIYKFSTK